MGGALRSPVLGRGTLRGVGGQDTAVSSQAWVGVSNGTDLWLINAPVLLLCAEQAGTCRGEASAILCGISKGKAGFPGCPVRLWRSNHFAGLKHLLGIHGMRV